jgi:hypothetical protein
MTIDSTPSLSEVASEFGGSAPHSLTEYYGSAFSDNSYASSSGAISLSSFRNKTKYLWSFRQKIVASDAQGYDRFGTDVSLSRYGDYAIVGASREDTGATDAGAAYIFKKSGSSWSQQAKIQASDRQMNDKFGKCTSICGTGDYAIIGAPDEDTGGTSAGAAYIFKRSGSSWSQQAKIQASDKDEYNVFGQSGSMDRSGTTAAVGAFWAGDGDPGAGAVYIFTRSGTTWSQQAKCEPSNPTVWDDFGVNSEISGDGNYLIAGSYGEDTDGTNAGAAYIFKKSGSSWSQQKMLKASDPATSDHFGQAVSIDYDGNTVAVGSYMEDTGAADAGSVYIYTRSGTTWTQQQKIQTTDRHAQDYFGFDVSLSDDGNTLLASGNGDDEGGTNAGAAYIYSRSGTTWTQRLKFTASDAQGYDYFGQDVGISGDGKTVISGAYYEDTGGTNSGAAYIHDLP